MYLYISIYIILYIYIYLCIEIRDKDINHVCNVMSYHVMSCYVKSCHVMYVYTYIYKHTSQVAGSDLSYVKLSNDLLADFKEAKM